MINNLLFTLAKISKNPETAKRFRDLLCIQLCTQYLEGNLITLSTSIKMTLRFCEVIISLLFIVLEI